MSYELTLEIAEDSQEGRNIEAAAEEACLTREDAARQLLRDPSSLRYGAPNRPGNGIVGLFSAPEDASVLDEAMNLVFEERSRRNAPVAQ